MKRKTAVALKWIALVILALGIVHAVLLGLSARSLRRAYADLEAAGRPMSANEIIPPPLSFSENAASLYEAAVLQLKARASGDTTLYDDLSSLSAGFLGDEPDAAASFRAAAEADPASWQARYALALAYLEAGQARSAVAPLQEAVAIVPEDGNVRLALASAYDQVGQAGDALVAARAALPLLTDPEAQAQARFIAGRSLYLQGNFANADAEFAQVVELRPSSASAQLWAGLTRYQLGDHAGAVLYYERAVQLDPNSIAARVNLGASYLAVERYRDAEGVYRLLVQQNPRDGESFHNLGWSLYAQQNDEGARGAWASSCQLGYQPACSAPR